MEGTTLLQYEIQKLLGRGAMGAVYKALDTRLETHRALKFILPGHPDMAKALVHLTREAKAQAKLFHPNIAALLELHSTDDTHFLVMEYVDGPTLDVHLKESKPSPEERLNLALQVACALDAAHAQGILHRDIKPQNVLVAPDGTVKVTDFGLARAVGQTTISLSGETRGTATYMAPEVFRGEILDETADVWSLGILAYEVLEGKPPFSGETFEEVGYKVLNTPPAPLSKKVKEAFPGIGDFIDRCLDKDREARISNGGEAFTLLAEIATISGLGRSLIAHTSYKTKTKRKNWLKRGFYGAAVLAAAVIALWILTLATRDLEYHELLPGLDVLSGESSPSWDPTGNHAAFIMSSDPGVFFTWNLTMAAEGLTERHEVDSGYSFRSITWNPKFQAWAMQCTDGLLVCCRDAEGAFHNQWLPGGVVRYLSWSRNGDRLIYYLTESEGAGNLALNWIEVSIEESDLHLSTPRQLEIHNINIYGPNIHLLYPTYILEDRYIAFSMTRLGEDMGVFVVPAEGGEAKMIMEGSVIPSLLIWKPKQRALLFYSLREKAICQLKLKRSGEAKSRGLEIVLPYENVADFDYNPATRQFLLHAGSHRTNLWKIPPDLDSGRPERLRTLYEVNYTPTLSPDESTLFYASHTYEAGMELRRYNLGNGTDEELLKGSWAVGNTWLPVVDPQNRYLTFCGISTSGETHDIWYYDLLVPTLQSVKTVENDAMDPSWTADGMALYYVETPQEDDSADVIKRCPVERRGDTILDFGEPVEVYTSESLAYPLPDSEDRYLLFQGRDGDQATIFWLEIGKDRATPFIRGSKPTFDPSRKDLFYMAGQTFCVLRDWRQRVGSGIVKGEEYYRLPADLRAWGRHSMAVGEDGIYTTLLESIQGRITVLGQER